MHHGIYEIPPFISIYITLYTPVVYQSVHIFLYYPVHTCCLPVSPYLPIDFLMSSTSFMWGKHFIMNSSADLSSSNMSWRCCQKCEKKWSYYWSMIFSCLVINCYFLVHLIGLKNPPPNYGNSSEVEHFQTNDIGNLYTRPLRKTWELLSFT